MKRTSMKKPMRKPAAVAKGGRRGFNNIARPANKTLKKGRS